MDEYNFGLGFNVSNCLYFGASISVTDIDYKYSSLYDDFFTSISKKDDNLYLENMLNTKGTAVSANIGVITNLQKLRLGVAYHSPRLYTMTDYYGAWAGTEISGFPEPKMENNTPEDSYSEYRFQTPDKWIFSAAVVLGQSALISADYELMNYNRMLFTDKNGGEDFAANDYIKDDYTWSHTIKLGTEIKITKQFAVRAGYMMQTSPMLKQLANNDVEVLPAGTIPHFAVTSKPTNYFTAGLGYRFNPNFYMDLACVYRYNNSDAYAFSNTYARNGQTEVLSVPANLKTKTTRLVLTLGYKF
jgi:long-subunit fatty acid transport protein